MCFISKHYDCQAKIARVNNKVYNESIDIYIYIYINEGVVSLNYVRSKGEFSRSFDNPTKQEANEWHNEGGGANAYYKYRE